MTIGTTIVLIATVAIAVALAFAALDIAVATPYDFPPGAPGSTVDRGVPIALTASSRR